MCHESSAHVLPVGSKCHLATHGFLSFLCPRKDLPNASLLFCSVGSRAAVTLQPPESLLLAGQGGGLLPRYQLCGRCAASPHERRASLRNDQIPHV